MLAAVVEEVGLEDLAFVDVVSEVFYVAVVVLLPGLALISKRGLLVLRVSALATYYSSDMESSD